MQQHSDGIVVMPHVYYYGDGLLVLRMLRSLWGAHAYHDWSPLYLGVVLEGRGRGSTYLSGHIMLCYVTGNDLYNSKI